MTAENSPAINPNLISRIKGIILQPKLEWPVIAAESASVKGLFTGYAMILAAIGPVCSLIGSALFGFPMGVLAAIITTVVGYVLALVAVYIVGIIIDALAPSFGSEKNMVQSMKLAVYSMTPAWVAGVLNLVPLIAGLAFIAALYGVYVMYLGFGPVKNTPEDKKLPYTVVTILIAIVLQVIAAMIVGLAMAPFIIAAAVAG
ncbi:Yip1 family protein [uncultured Brevundimonas sp.]|uniref:Yip1 family protein n=1 Tax=uncultured Brevundimonas sp. TaxID=213418 RepID=UPI00260C15C1|nr:Yip1 family protein [uncultured Brevundimonas sp.]